MINTNEKNKPVILVVDDDKSIVSALKRILRKLDCIVHIENNSNDGLEYLQKNEVNLVIADIRLQKSDGIEFFEKIYNDWPEVIRMVLTGYSDLEMTINAINKCGIYKYISKPWEDHDLLMTIKQALENQLISRQRKELEEKALEMASEKESFYDKLSYDLHRILNVNFSMLELLMETDLSSKQKQFIDTAFHNNQDLLTLVNDVLDIRDAEKDNIHINHSIFNVNSAVKMVIDQNKANAESKHLALNYRIQKDISPWVQGDVTRIRQVLSNLVTNGIKYTNNGGIYVYVRRIKENEQEMTLAFEVVDSGIGINEEMISDIFDFTKISKHKKSSNSLISGLGLSLSKKLVELMGGDIVVTSEEGVATTFKVILPFKKASLVDYSKYRFSNISQSHVLVVEDCDSDTTIIPSYLSKIGLDYLVVKSGIDAIKLIEQYDRLDFKFDHVVIGKQLRDMSGFELMDKIKPLTDKRGTKTIMVASYGKRNDGNDANKCGIDAYLSKPFDHVILSDCLSLLSGFSDEDGSTLVSKHLLREIKDYHQMSAIEYEQCKPTESSIVC